MTTNNVLSLEEFAFNLLNQLADEYGIYDDGSFARAIQEANTIEAMQPIISRLQGELLIAMKPEFPFGEFDNGNHWRGE